MYEILVFLPGALHPVERKSLKRPADALKAVPALLAAHPGCERVTVMAGDAVLFSVDGKGEKLHDSKR